MIRTRGKWLRCLPALLTVGASFVALLGFFALYAALRRNGWNDFAWNSASDTLIALVMLSAVYAAAASDRGAVCRVLSSRPLPTGKRWISAAAPGRTFTRAS